VENHFLRLVCYRRLYLKVVSEEKGGGKGVGKVANIIGSGLGLWRSRVIFILNVLFLLKLLFPSTIATAKLQDYYFYIQ
jgi:hypothetical protein